MAKSRIYIATRGFEYPQSLAVRNRIRGGEVIAREDREPIHQVLEGDMISPPSDLLQSWLQRGLIEEVHNGPEE